MIQYVRKFEFWNNEGGFKVVATTKRHPASRRASMRPTKVSNGTLLIIDVKGPKKKYTFRRDLDIRYAYIEQSSNGIDVLVKDILEDNFDVKL